MRDRRWVIAESNEHRTSRHGRDQSSHRTWGWATSSRRLQSIRFDGNGRSTYRSLLPHRKTGRHPGDIQGRMFPRRRRALPPRIRSPRCRAHRALRYIVRNWRRRSADRRTAIHRWRCSWRCIVVLRRSSLGDRTLSRPNSRSRLHSAQKECRKSHRHGTRSVSRSSRSLQRTPDQNTRSLGARMRYRSDTRAGRHRR